MIPYRKEIEAVIPQYSSNFSKHKFHLFPCKVHIEQHM